MGARGSTRGSALVFCVTCVACGRSVAFLPMPDDPNARSAVFLVSVQGEGIIAHEATELPMTPEDVELTASERNRGAKVEALLYRVPLTELGLSSGQLPLREGSGVHLTEPDRVVAAEIRDEDASWQEASLSAEARELELALARPCYAFALELRMALDDPTHAIGAMTSKDGDLFIVLEDGAVLRFDGVTTSNVSLSPSPGYLVAGAADPNEEQLWLLGQDGQLWHGAPTKDEMLLQLHAQWPVSPSAERHRMVVRRAPALEVFALSGAGPLVRADAAGTAEQILNLGTRPAYGQPGLIVTRSGEVIVGAHESPEIIFIDGDTVRRETIDPTEGFTTGLGEVSGFGLIAATGNFNVYAQPEPGSDWQPRATLSDHWIYTALPGPKGGALLAGSRGWFGGLLPDGELCAPSERLRTGAISFVVPLGEDRFALLGDTSNSNEQVLTIVHVDASEL